jgi:hypothetical protein
MARERARERVFGPIADGIRDRTDRVVGVAQALGGARALPSGPGSAQPDAQGFLTLSAKEERDRGRAERPR